MLVRVDGEHLQRESRVSEPRVGYPFGEMYCMSCIAGGLGQGRGKRETNASIAVSTEGRPETGPSPNRTGQDRTGKRLTLTRRTLHWLHPRRLFAWLLCIGMIGKAEKDRAELRPQVGGFGRTCWAHTKSIRDVGFSIGPERADPE